MVCVKKGDVMHISRPVKRASVEESIRKDVEVSQDLIEKPKFSAPMSISKGLQTQFLIDCVS